MARRAGAPLPRIVRCSTLSEGGEGGEMSFRLVGGFPLFPPIYGPAPGVISPPLKNSERPSGGQHVKYTR